MTAETPRASTAEMSAIDAEVDRMAERAYGDSNYDDVVLDLRITKYAEASLSREVARLSAEVAAAEQRGAETEREEIAKALHIARFDHKDGPDSFYNGMRSAVALVRARAVAAAEGGAS